MRTTQTICENRLFRRLYKSGKSVVTPLFVLYFRKNGRENNRLGITTSTKVGKAVQRSRCRRVLREAYRLLERDYGIKKGYLIVIVARESASRVKMQLILDDLIYAFTKLGMIKGKTSEDGEQ